MQIIEANFQSILPLWQKELWPGRDDIEGYSWMKFGGGHYENFYNPEKKFWLALDKDKKVGVISAHSLPDQESIRIRGLWVHKDYRRKNIGSLLISQAIDWALDRGVDSIWTYPRKEAWSVYEKHGFVSDTFWIEDEKGLEHCYASKRL